MAKPLSNDLRERVVAAVSDGESIRAIPARFEVAASSVVKWLQRHRATGSVDPDKMGGYRKHILEPHRRFIFERLAQDPHLTLHGLKAEPASRGISVSHNAIWKFIHSVSGHPRPNSRPDHQVGAIASMELDTADHQRSSGVSGGLHRMLTLEHDQRSDCDDCSLGRWGKTVVV